MIDQQLREVRLQEQRLEDALRTAAAGHYAGVARHPAFEAAVGEFVDAHRARGSDVVTVIRAVRARLSAGHVGAGRACPARLLDRAVRWSIARYYAEGGNGSGAGANSRDGTSRTGA